MKGDYDTHGCDIVDHVALMELIAEAQRGAAAIGWDAAVAAMKYEDGTPVEIASTVNPYRADRIATQPTEGSEQ